MRSRRSRRQLENENQVIQAIKWWQNRTAKLLFFLVLPLALTSIAFALWIDTPAGHEFMGWAEQDRQDKKELESLEKDMEKKYNEFTESTNEDVQKTIDEIEGTQDTTGAEYYNEDPYTAPETQESAEQPTEQTNGANNNVSERPKKTVETNDTAVGKQAETPQNNLPEPVPDESKQANNTYLGPTKGELNGYDEWDEEDKEKYYSWDEQKRQAYEESIYREEE